MTAASDIHAPTINFPILLTLTVIVCLAAMHTVGIDTSIPIATAAAALVFCSRQRIFTTWEILEYLLQAAPAAGEIRTE